MIYQKHYLIASILLIMPLFTTAMEVKKKKKAEQKEQQWRYIQTNDGATVGISPKSLLFSKSGFFKAITNGRFEKKGIADNPIILESINKTQLKLIHQYIVKEKSPKKSFERYLQDYNIDNLNQLIVTSDFLCVKGIFKFVVPCLIKKLQNPNVLNNWLKAGWSKLLTENEEVSDYIKKNLTRNIKPTPQYLEQKKSIISKVLEGHNERVSSVAFSSDGAMIASGSWDNTVKIWDVETGAEIHTLTGHHGTVDSVEFSPDSTTLASGSRFLTSKFWNVKIGTEILMFPENKSLIYSVTFSPNGIILALGLNDGTIKFCKLKTGAEMCTLTGHTDSVFSLKFSQNGNMLASGSRDKTVKIWDVETGVEMRTLTGHQNYVISVAFSHDGKILVSIPWLGKIKFWKVKTGTEISDFIGHTKHVNTIAFSPDSIMFASGSYDKKIRFWKVKTGNRIRTFTGHTDYVNAIAFSPDSIMFVSGSKDNTIRLWRLIDLQDIEQLSPLELLFIHAQQHTKIINLKQTYSELYKIYNQASDLAKALITPQKESCWQRWFSRRKINNVIRIIRPFLKISVFVLMVYSIYTIYKMDKRIAFIFLALYLQLIRMLIL